MSNVDFKMAFLLTERGEIELANIAYADLEVFYHLASKVVNSASDVFQDAAVLRMPKCLARIQASARPAGFIEMRPERVNRVKSSESVASLPKMLKAEREDDSRSAMTTDANASSYRFKQDQNLQIGGTVDFPYKLLSVQKMHTIREACRQGLASRTLQAEHRRNSTAGIYAIIVNSFIMKGVQLDESLRLKLCKGHREKSVNHSSHFNQYFASQGLGLVEITPVEWFLVDTSKMAA
jgi:hypothetical protein